ncbi:hypothetical protein GCM10029964_069480 [Kibdelosporangium lantanae]
MSEIPRDGTDLLPEVTADEVAFLNLSGGSTGVPKLIPRTHDDYLHSVRESADICGLTTESVYMATLPVSHNFTLSSLVYSVRCTRARGSCSRPHRVRMWRFR